MATRFNLKYAGPLVATLLFAVILAACGAPNQAAPAASGAASPTTAPAQSGAAASRSDEHGVIQHGPPEQVAAAARAAIADAGATGLLLAPGCGVAIDVPTANLRALRESVEIKGALVDA